MHGTGSRTIQTDTAPGAVRRTRNNINQNLSKCRLWDAVIVLAGLPNAAVDSRYGVIFHRSGEPTKTHPRHYMPSKRWKVKCLELELEQLEPQLSFALFSIRQKQKSQVPVHLALWPLNCPWWFTLFSAEYFFSLSAQAKPPMRLRGGPVELADDRRPTWRISSSAESTRRPC